jgi:hypothetical protein
MTQNPMYPPQPPPVPGAPGYGYPVPQQGNGLAIAGLIFGILGFCVLFLGGIIGVILGFIGLRKTRDPQVGGRGLAIAAITVSCISLVTSIVISASIAFGGFAVLRGTAQVRAVARTFVQDVAAQNTAAARANAASELTDADISADSAVLHPLGTFTDMTSTQMNMNSVNGNATCHLAGIATFSGGTSMYDIDLTKIGNQWKVSSARFH